MLRKVLSSPVLEPLTLNDIYEHTHSDVDHEIYLAGLLPRARARFEEKTGRKLVHQTWQFMLPLFPTIIKLPFAPLREVVSIQYLNVMGEYETLPASEYRVIDYDINACIVPKINGCWPAIGFKTPDAIKIVCSFGHASVANNKINSTDIIDEGSYELAKQALLILIADWFRNREDTAPVQLYETPNAFKAVCSELSVDIL